MLLRNMMMLSDDPGPGTTPQPHHLFPLILFLLMLLSLRLNQASL